LAQGPIVGRGNAVAMRVAAVLAAAALCSAAERGAAAYAADVIADADADTGGANPIRRVVGLLQKMQQEITAEAEKDEELNERFVCYCSKNDGELSKETADLRAKLPVLKADIETAQSEKAQLDLELTAHQTTRTEAKQAIAAATKQREKEAAEFAASSAELKGNIAATESAQDALHRGLTGSFLQSPSAGALRAVLLADTRLGREDRESLTAFLSQQDTAQYTPASGEVIGILHRMQEEFKASLKDITTAEDSALADFQGLVAAKEKEIQAATEAIESKTARAGEAAVKIVSLKNDLKDTQDSLGEDELFLMDLKKNCASKAKEYDERKQMRNEEQIALSETIKLLNSDDALDLFKQTLPSPVLLQSADHDRDLRRKALKILQRVRGAGDRAVDLNFITLALRGKKTGFDKVIKMITDMVAQLKVEQKDDEKHRDWCNNEFATSGAQAKDLDRRAADLGTKAAEAQQAVDAIGEDLAGLRDGLKALDRSVEDATTQRKDEHKQFLAEQQDNNAALQLLEMAKNRMSKFYNPSQYVEPEEEDESLLQKAKKPRGGAKSFISMARAIMRRARRSHQEPDDDDEVEAPTPRPPPPRTSGPYQKRDAGGPLALLDKLRHELELDMASAARDEQEAQRSYENFMSDSVRKRETDSAAVTEKEAQKADLEADVMASKDLQKRKTTELLATREYIQQLHGSCDFLLQNFDLRREARANEVEALKNAKAVLHGAAYSFQQKKPAFLQRA